MISHISPLQGFDAVLTDPMVPTGSLIARKLGESWPVWTICPLLPLWVSSHQTSTSRPPHGQLAQGNSMRPGHEGCWLPVPTLVCASHVHRVFGQNELQGEDIQHTSEC